MIKLLTIIGARPQIIKSAALSLSIKHKYSDKLKEVLVHTGQHYDENMSQVFFNEMSLPAPEYELGTGSGIHGKQTAKMIVGIEEVILEQKPDFIVLYGDTNSTLAGAIAASKMDVPIVHIEAGLRSFNKRMPEEINRIVCDHCSTYLFAPTEAGLKNLLNEGFSLNKPPYNIDRPGIFNYGDIMYDNCLRFSDISDKNSTILEDLNLSGAKYLLATIHRDFNTDNNNSILQILRAFKEISLNYSVDIVFPVHPRTKKVLLSIFGQNHELFFSNNRHFKMIDPVSFFDMIQLERKARIILTDSGGVQKEAYFYKKPCIILRKETEWVEILKTGKAVLTGTNEKKIVEAYKTLIDHTNGDFPSLFGKGNTSDLICEELIKSK